MLISLALSVLHSDPDEVIKINVIISYNLRI